MTRILAVIDPNEEVPSALERCKQLPPESDLVIHVVRFLEREDAAHFGETYREQSNRLQRQIQPYIAEGYRITAEVVIFSSLYEAVIEAADAFEADFVVKPMRQHSVLATVVRTSTDWQLIRHCQRPLLLVSDIAETRGKPVLAAVDVKSGDDAHESLNSVVAAQARAVASVLDSEIELVNAYRATPPMMAVGTIDAVAYPTPMNLQKEHITGLEEMIEKQFRPDTRFHCVEGSAAHAITDTARNIDAGLIVIGTVARTGIGGAIIGNTAETVLESSERDVLVVKLPEA